MKILHVLDHSLPVQSGYAFRSAAIIREQRRLGWQTVQLTGPKQGKAVAAREIVDGIEYRRTGGRAGPVAVLPAGGQLDVVRRLRRELRDLIASEQPDLIQAHSPCLNGLAALGLGRPVVYELRSSWEDAAVSSGVTSEGSLRYRASRWLETQVLRRAQAVTVICEGLRHEVRQRGIPEERITVIPNAVDTSQFAPPTIAPESARRRWNLQGRTVIGFIGSLFAWEGLGLLLEALPAIRRWRENAAVLLVGAGIDEDNLRRKATALGIAPHVVFAGALPHDAVGEAYAAVDLLVFPRLRMRLTELVTPLKPLEAMAMGKPLVASDVGGHRELIEDGRTGDLFAAGDADALARAVCRLLGDPSRAASLARAGMQVAREQRSWSGSVRAYAGAYERVLGRVRA
ncbi:MAG: TIGR04063 family PEP-CTERM/XrtA system glycosyltransferase [Gammaproteobacteria bacterium]